MPQTLVKKAWETGRKGFELPRERSWPSCPWVCLPLEEVPALGEELERSEDGPGVSDQGWCVFGERGFLEEVG